MIRINGQTDKERALRFLYHTVPGRVLLKAVSCRGVSRACGALLDSRLSKPLISRFIRKYHIQMSAYCAQPYRCFNDFFSREIKAGQRPFPVEPNALLSPCDGLLSVYPVTKGLVLPIKQSAYTIAALVGGDAVAARYEDGLCLVFRLCVDHYHRYCYIDDGKKGENVFLPGKLHTVRPIALAELPVFIQNCREYTVMETEHFGVVTQVEVGALLVGKIQNHHGPGPIARGQEKGRFLYGGSTVILLLEKGRAHLREDLCRAASQGVETPVRMGQILGYAPGAGPLERE